MNHLQHESSPYLLQHAQNPVDWYPWGEEAFRRAQEEDKPIFLSIGYSTCHWCHVMARESFEDEEAARLLNDWFVPIKVDREERPDIDSVYMAFCMAATRSGGWPLSVFLTPSREPFFAGTYYPPQAFCRLLKLIHEKWQDSRPALLHQAEELAALLHQQEEAKPSPQHDLLSEAVRLYQRAFDRQNGGFGDAPKFPSPHNLLFLLAYHRRHKDASCLEMADFTLRQMYRGGLFDHIGGGFCRYSTDAQFLAPHFEKMLYDNALLILAYCEAYASTKNELHLLAARRTADYVLRELKSPQGGFYSAQDADSEGEEGKYYLFASEELLRLLGPEQGGAFCRHFDIRPGGNFEGKSIPNLLRSDPRDHSFDPLLEPVYQYRKGRTALHLDDKILTAWNGLMIAALCRLYRATGEEKYRQAAQDAEAFLRRHLWDGSLYVSWRDGKRGAPGFLDDYACFAYAQLALYDCTLDPACLGRAKELCRDAWEKFWDGEHGGFFLYGAGNEPLILRPKESYDGAMPSGNSMMAWCLVRLEQFDEEFGPLAGQQREYLSAEAARYPAGHGMFLLALLDHTEPPPRIKVGVGSPEDARQLPLRLPGDAAVTPDGPVKDGQTTFTVCQQHVCLPPTHQWPGRYS